MVKHKKKNKSMKAKIICDASFDDKFGIAGYAGRVSVGRKGNKVDYRGSLSGIKTSNEAELNAIYEGLKEAIRLAPKATPITSVVIHSDSQNAIDRIENKKGKKLKRSELEFYLLKRIRLLVRDNGFKMHCNHVKAHQKASEASPLEAEHNIIDKKAYRVLRESRKTLYNASMASKQSTRYGVIVESHPSEKMSQMYRQIAYDLAKSGMVARVSLQGEYREMSTHPFFLGVQDYALESGQLAQKLFNQVHWRKGEILGFHDRVFGCQGMDRCLFNDHNSTLKNKIYDRSDEANRAGAASRLIMGYQSKSRSTDVAVSDFSEEPSKFILDLSIPSQRKENMPVSQWAKQFCERLNIRHFNNIKELQKDYEVNVLSKPIGNENSFREFGT